MVQLCKRGEHVGIARFAHAHAEVHIVEGHSKALVQTVHLLVDAPAHHQAGGSDRIHILCIDQTSHIAGVAHREVLVHVGRKGQKAEADARVLDSVVRIKQLCAHAAHTVLLGVHEHFFDPARRNDLRIVVEQQQVFAGGFLCAKVVQGAVVEAGALPCDHLQVLVLLLQLFIAAEGGRLPAVVLDDDDLKILIGAPAVDGLHAGAQVGRMVAAGDQDADPARLCDGIVRLIEARRTRDHGNFIHRHTHTLVVGIQGLDRSFQTVGLGRNVACHAGGAGAPVVQQMRDMHDLVRLFGQAQVEIIVLTAVVGCTLIAAHSGQQLCAEHAQVADIIVGAQIIQHIIRLEMVNGQVVDVALKGHFIRIHKVCALFGNGLCHVPQSTGVQDIIVVQQGDELARCQCKALIGVARNALVLFQLLVADAGVFRSTGCYGLAHRLVLSGIHKAQLPVLIGLVLHRVQQLHQKLLRRIVQRHHDADARRGGLVGRLPYQQLCAGKAVGAHGPAREQLRIFLFGLCLRTHAGNAHPAQLAQKDERREGVCQLTALADKVAQRPAHLPESRAGHIVQCLFQILLMAAAQRKIAAQAFQLSRLLFAGALGLLHPLSQIVQRHLVACQQLLCILHSGAAAEQRGLLGFAAVLPLKIPVQALCGQLLCTVSHGRCIGAYQQHLCTLQCGQIHPFRVLHHQQGSGALLCILRQQLCAGLFQCFGQCAAAAQHLNAGRGQLPHDALRQCTAALGLSFGFFFLIHSDLRSYGTFLS